MALSTWWRGDPLPELLPLTDFRAALAQDDAHLGRLTGLDAAEIRRRRRDGHLAFVGTLRGSAVAYGWLATRRAAIGELNLAFQLQPWHGYLWDFATLPAWRGRGVYPHMLQAILRRRDVDARYFWIIRAPENGASGAGIRKAGFTPVGRLSLLADGRAGLAPLGDGRRARVGAGVLGVPLVDAGLYPCWHCGGAAYPPSGQAAACTCAQTVHPDDGCACAQ